MATSSRVKNKPAFVVSLGFTLVEVLVALTIFSVAAIAASSASTGYINSLDRYRTRTLAHFVAQNKVADMRMQGTWLDGESTVSVNEHGRNWQIKTKAKPTTSEKLKRFEIQVSDAQDNEAKLAYSLTVFLQKPEGAS